jgi:hypothetical protein
MGWDSEEIKLKVFWPRLQRKHSVSATWMKDFRGCEAKSSRSFGTLGLNDYTHYESQTVPQKITVVDGVAEVTLKFF